MVHKSYQERVTDIKDFVWKIYMSYQPLNPVTKPFKFPFGRYNITLDDLSDNHGILFCMSLDAQQGCHQIKIRSNS